MAKTPKHVRTSHPTRMLGRLPNDPSKLRLTLHAKVGAPVAPPASVDWFSQVNDWPMNLNDQLGCCTASGSAHTAQMVNWYGQTQNAPVSDPDVLTMYKAISGYNGSPRTDVGATLQDALSYWRKTGVGGNKITAFAQVNSRDINLVKNCIAIFGSVFTGFNFASDLMTQFEAGQPWTIPTSRQGQQIDGGHCVPIIGYDANYLTCITWGAVQKIDYKCFSKYWDEVWVPIDLDWLRAVGTSPAGVDTATLNADYQALFPGQAAPFPNVVVPPVDPPVVVPPVDPSADPDAVLAAALRAWLSATGQ